MIPDYLTMLSIRDGLAYADGAYADDDCAPESIEFSSGSEMHRSGTDVLFFKGDTCSIRGTDSRPDWANNFDFEPNYYGEHHGYDDAVDGFECHVVEWCQRLASQGIVPRLRGHSRGGGIAMVLGRRVAEAKIKCDIMTFAAPPVGTRLWCDGLKFMPSQYRPRVTRVTCGRDILPRVTLKKGCHVDFAEVYNLPAPPWTWAFPGVWGILHHRRWAYWYGVRAMLKKTFKPYVEG